MWHTKKCLIKNETQAMRPRARAGTQILSLLAAPINAAVLRALIDGPKPLMTLSAAAGTPSQSTLRTRLRELTELGVLRRNRQEGFPRALEYELLAGPGHELRVAMEILRAWLAGCPDGPLVLGTPQAKSAVKALVEGWSSTMIRALAARPLSLTELNQLIKSLNYPSLERRLDTLRRLELVEPLPTRRRGTAYTATKWLRRGIAPLAAAARWERANITEEAAPIRRLDIEAAFLLATPLATLADKASGTCRLVVELANGAQQDLAGVLVDVKEGQVASCVADLQGDAGGWAAGPPSAWLAAVLEQDVAKLEIGGNSQLAHELLGGLHSALFPSPRAAEDPV